MPIEGKPIMDAGSLNGEELGVDVGHDDRTTINLVCSFSLLLTFIAYFDAYFTLHIFYVKLKHFPIWALSI